MDCERCADDMTAYLDGELSAAGTKQVRSHLEICKSCAEELRSLQEAALFVESHARELDPTPKTWDLVHARIAALALPSTSSRYFQFPLMNRWRMAAATLAAAAAFAFGVWGYMRYEEAQRDLRQYMNQYIQAREAQEQIYQVIATDTESDPRADNPFVEVKSTSIDNPFMSEDQ